MNKSLPRLKYTKQLFYIFVLLFIIGSIFYVIIKEYSVEFAKRYIVPYLENFYGKKSINELDKYNPLIQYGISLKDLSEKHCEYIIFNYNIRYIDLLSNESRKKAILHVCSQIIYSIVKYELEMNPILRELKEEKKLDSNVIKWCIIDYSKKIEYITKQDITPFVSCILDEITD